MVIHLINTGRELMLGWRLNTHHQWISRQLYLHGYQVARQVAVDDSADAIEAAVTPSLGSADLVITTGGLGPTSDDRTRDVIAGLLQRPLHPDPAVLQHIKAFFQARQREFPDRVAVQAMVPEGAQILLNAHGTAPGLAMECPPASGRSDPGCLIMLPGPPRELQPMFRNQVLPLIQTRFPLPAPVASRILRSTGLGESWVEEKVDPALQPLASSGLEIGYCSRPGEVDIQLLARGAEASQTVAKAEAIIRTLIGHSLFGTGDEELESVILAHLLQRRQTLAVAESCTGGFIANRLTNVPGASGAFLAGFITYSNAAKETLLGLQPSTLKKHGAVSADTAQEMALATRQRTGADYALAVTGIAGPSGGTREKPVGTVFLGLATAGGVEVRRHLNPFDRETFKFVTSQQALEWLREALLGAD